MHFAIFSGVLFRFILVYIPRIQERYFNGCMDIYMAPKLKCGQDDDQVIK